MRRDVNIAPVSRQSWRGKWEAPGASGTPGAGPGAHTQSHAAL